MSVVQSGFHVFHLHNAVHKPAAVVQVVQRESSSLLNIMMCIFITMSKV